MKDKGNEKEMERKIITHIERKKIECKRRKTKKCAKVYKLSAADSLTETIILSEYFCHDDIMHHRAKENTHRASKPPKKPFFPYYSHIIDNKPHNTNARRPSRAYIAYFKP